MSDPTDNLQRLKEAHTRIKELEAANALLLVQIDKMDTAISTQRDRIAQLEETLNVVQEEIIWSDQMFTARDEMNSKVHCAPVRLSPITERVKQALIKIVEMRNKAS